MANEPTIIDGVECYFRNLPDQPVQFTVVKNYQTISMTIYEARLASQEGFHFVTPALAKALLAMAD